MPIKNIFKHYLKLLLLILLCSSYLYGDKTQKRILYLNSYHQSMTWASDITKGVKETLDVEKDNFILYIENMDTKRHSGEEYYESLAILYQTKYKNTKFDLILASDNNAFDFLKKYRDKIFGDVPVSFSGVNNYEDSMIEGYNNYTGIAEISSEKETLELIVKLHPKAKNVYVINDYLKTGRAWQKTLEKNLEGFDKINIIYNENQSLSQLQEKIKNLPEDYVLLMGVYFADKNNQYITYEKMARNLLDISPVPVYTLTNFTISKGVIGGKVLSGYEHGRMMAKLGISILQGVDANKIDVVKEGVNKFIFNQLALDKFNIDKNLLPKKHEIINKNEEVINKYGIAISIIMIILSTVLILGILYLYKKGIKSEKSILKLIVYGPIVFIPTVISILTYGIISNNLEIHKQDLEQLKTNAMKEQKTFTINKIELVSQYIYNLKDKDEVLNYINNYKYGDRGYLFALDVKGNVLAHGFLPQFIGTNMIDASDLNGLKFIAVIINSAIINSLDLVEYLWYNPNTNQHEKKYTYAKYIPKYDMVIASGVYSKDINHIINQKTIKLNERNEMQIQNMLFIALVVIILSTILSVVLSNIIKKIFEQYNQVIDAKNKNLEYLNNSLEHKIEEEVKKSREKDSLIFEQSKMASMGDMIGNIAHQWRQPLSIISTAATGMMVKIEYKMMNDVEVIKNCEIINQNTQYLSQTIEDFKNYIKNDREIKTFNLKSNVENLLTLVEASLKTHQIDVILDLDDRIKLNGYPNELIQCMMNIINNAKDALLSNENEKYIFITIKEDNNYIKIIFKDNAKGISKEIINNIFEPYFTTKHKSQGTGLGLSMTYNIITKGMKGRINVTNTTYKYKGKEYKGAEFIISLPKNPR